jgi:hypothetical protein
MVFVIFFLTRTHFSQANFEFHIVENLGDRSREKYWLNASGL